MSQIQTRVKYFLLYYFRYIFRISLSREIYLLASSSFFSLGFFTSNRCFADF